MPTDKRYYQNAEWRENHKKNMREKQRCAVCDCMVVKYAMARHKRTNKHIVKVLQNMTIDQPNNIDPSTVKAIVG